MKRHSLLFVVFVVFFLSAGSVAWAANGLEQTAVGARSAGMGGADLAIATDAMAIWSNPAGLIQLTGHRIDFGSGLLIPQQHFENNLNDVDGQADYLPSPHIAYGFKPADFIAVGFGVSADGGSGASNFKMDHALLGSDLHYFSRIETLKFAGAVAWAPHPTIAVSLSPQLLLARMNYEMPYTRPTEWLHGDANPSSNREFGEILSDPYEEHGLEYDEVTFKLKMQEASAYGVGARVGALWMPHEIVHVGLMYQMQINMEYRGHARVDFKPQFDDAQQRLADYYTTQGISPEQAAEAARTQFVFWGIEDPDLESNYDSRVELNRPRQAGLGVAIRPTASLLIGLDAKWINWSKTMDKVKVIVKRANNRNAAFILGSDQKKLPLETKWSDQLVAAAGLQYDVITPLSLRVGYNYSNNPVPEDRALPVFPGLLEHHVTGGIGYRYGIFEANAAYEYGVPNTSEAPSSHMLADEYNSATFTQGSHNTQLTFSFLF
ncbi:MAG: outer membrane protein transport protein [Candidatus Lernaella stagnicola]|nr:outer membrane protein transport protein [Candidatus Lernaella stagnicola]